MARPNYGFQKRQKELKKQKKKEQKLQQKLADDSLSPEETAAELDDAVQEMRDALEAMDKNSQLYTMGCNILASLDTEDREVSLDLVEGFLERLED
jgi:hypothetical protein